MSRGKALLLWEENIAFFEAKHCLVSDGRGPLSGGMNEWFEYQ